ncbi:MAG: uracil phosphoribosyltransferase, partial [Cyclobacteriaceae bacterium]|nr:uracil phosphoribosyltransferase [Cyclobacteriaceae bacterium]
MPIFDLSTTNSVLNNFVAELRDIEIQNDPLRFRKNLQRIGEIMAYEISKSLSYKIKSTKTPLGISNSQIMDEKLVIGTILRAGLPMHEGFLNYFDRAENAFVSAYRKYTDKEHFDIHIEYISSPDINGKTLLLVDPMLATGASFELAYKALLSRGNPSNIHMASVIASQDGVNYLKEKLDLDRINLWYAAI